MLSFELLVWVSKRCTAVYTKLRDAVAIVLIEAVKIFYI